MRSQSNGLDYVSDSARLYQFTRLNGRPILESFAVHDGINPLRLFLHFFHFFQLFQGNNAGLINHKIFAMTHNLDSQGRPVKGNRGTDNELN